MRGMGQWASRPESWGPSGPTSQQKKNLDDTVEKRTESKLLILVQRLPGCNDAVRKDVIQWMDADDNIELTEDAMVKIVNEEKKTKMMKLKSNQYVPIT